MGKITDLILNGPPEDSPVGVELRDAHWSLIKLMPISYSDWKELATQYANNPMYVGKSTAEPKERLGRLANALSGGNVKGLSVDFTWKRFIEGLVLVNVETLTMSIKTYRGRFEDTKVVKGYCHPQRDLLRTLNGEDDEDLRGSASDALNLYFQNAQQTAEQVMEHILLKVLWSLFAAYGITESQWRQLVTKYVNNSDNCPQITSRRSDRRHNLQQSIRHTKKLSWKRFLEALKAIDVRKFECTFLVHVPGQYDVEHSFEVDVTALSFRSNKNEPE
ncbi:hypothetical protein pEaSNUABM11_00253 [Erwinia phage pEa_SNUABM_11]|nr:hypothetical protein pEaSNUABM11_00253 [Erwinia phage pEa_SNUABM_11]